MTEQGADLGRYDDWLGWLRKQGESDPDVLVVFVGGSAVTGGYDEHSDLDVEVLTTPGEAVATYRRMLDAALRDFEVHHLWELPEATWPDGPRPQQLHLDLSVSTLADLDRAHERALALGARLLEDRSDDPVEQLRIYADPAGHPFCIFVA